MRKLGFAAALAGFLIASALVRADDQGDAQKIIDKAVKAVGSDGKFKAATWKGKGKFYGLGEAIEYTGEWASQPPDRMRLDMGIDFNGMKIQITRVVDGDKGWSKTADMSMDMSKEELEEAKHELYAQWVARVTPLKQPGFKFKPLGESKVGDKAAAGVKVSREGHRDVDLYFDKETGLPLKVSTRVKDIMGGGTELTQETLFDDYQEASGIKVARKLTVNRDGKKYVEFEMSEYKPVEKLEDSTFKQ